MKIRIPSRAVICPLDKQWATVALTRREVELLLTADGYTASETARTLGDWDNGQGYGTGLKTGAKVIPGTWTSRTPSPTRARTYMLRGYHYAGTDVSSLVEVAA